MPRILTQSPAALCEQQPHLAIALAKLGIRAEDSSYSLETSLVLAGYEPAVVQQLLTATVLVRPVALAPRFQAMSLEELLADIVETHHSFLRINVPHVEQLLATLARQHAEASTQLKQAIDVFSRLAMELTLHMEKEEAYLFPLLQRVTHQQSRRQLAPLAISALLRELVDEHTHVADILDNLRQLLPLLALPQQDSLASQAAIDAINEFEQDLRVHVCKENLLLFPMALAVEATARHAAPASADLPTSTP